MKITTPEEMKPDLSDLENAVERFEEEFKKEGKGLNYYHLVITGELNKEVCQAVSNIYRKAGWRIATCRTSSDNGERPGLTGLKLEP